MTLLFYNLVSAIFPFNAKGNYQRWFSRGFRTADLSSFGLRRWPPIHPLDKLRSKAAFRRPHPGRLLPSAKTCTSSSVRQPEGLRDDRLQVPIPGFRNRRRRVVRRPALPNPSRIRLEGSGTDTVNRNASCTPFRVP